MNKASAALRTFMSVVLFSMLPVVVPIASGDQRLTSRIKDTETMRAVLTAKIPRKTPLAKARQFMEQEGFVCSLKEDAEFEDQRPLKHHVKYLYCERSDGFLVLTEWRISIILYYDNSTVDEIRIVRFLTGL